MLHLIRSSTFEQMSKQNTNAYLQFVRSCAFALVNRNLWMACARQAFWYIYQFEGDFYSRKTPKVRDA